MKIQVFSSAKADVGTDEAKGRSGGEEKGHGHGKRRLWSQAQEGLYYFIQF